MGYRSAFRYSLNILFDKNKNVSQNRIHIHGIEWTDIHKIFVLLDAFTFVIRISIHTHTKNPLKTKNQSKNEREM